MKVLLHDAATTELREAQDWYETAQAGLGDDLASEVDRALDVICDSPTSWPRWPGSPRTPAIRRFLLSRFPFAIASLVEPNRVIVLAVAHGKRRPGYWLHRLG